MNYTRIWERCKEIAGGPDFATAWAISLNTQGLKNFDGRVVKIGSTVSKYSELLARIAAYNLKNGLSSTSPGAGARVTLGKEAVSVARWAKAGAPETIAYLKGTPAAVSLDKTIYGELPAHFAFLNSPYGMPDEILLSLFPALMEIYSKFDATIATAYANGWAKGEVAGAGKRRSWVEEFMSYCLFRGIQISLPKEQESL